MSSGRYATRQNGSERRAAEVCSDDAAQLTDWPIERISEVVQPTDAQRPALDELRAASAKAVDMLTSGCPKDLPSIPTERLAAMESRLQVMLAAVQTVVRPWSASTSRSATRKSALQRHRDLRNVDARRCQAAGRSPTKN